jgi:hypothetical protein
MTPFTFRQTLQSHALLDGNGYAYIVRDEATYRPALLILDPAHLPGSRRTACCGTSRRTRDPIGGKRLAERVALREAARDRRAAYPRARVRRAVRLPGVAKILRDTIRLRRSRPATTARGIFRNDARPGIVGGAGGFPEKAIRNLREIVGAAAHRPRRTRTGRDPARRGEAGNRRRANARDAQLIENRHVRRPGDCERLRRAGAQGR